MADVVNAQLERMLPELEDFEKWRLFSRAEIKEIVRRRREFEYQLQRQSRIKGDFVRYVEYEKQLESLRMIRKKAVLVDLKAEGKKWSGHVSDRAGVTRIISIYKRAVARFKGDLRLWLEYLEFCRIRSPRAMSRVLAKALRLHPHIPGLWMYAASWNFEQNLNVTAARALMQRGIRMCPHSEELWLEYFRMELTYAQKLKTRKLVLGIEFEGDHPEEDPKSELSEKLARVIFRNAIVAVPSSLSFRQRFIEALDEFELVQSTIEDEISASIIKDFSNRESCWDWKARRCLKTSWEDAVNVFEDALRSLPSAQMFELYAKFLESLLDSDDYAGSISSSLLQLYELGERTCSSVKLVEGHIHLLSRKGFPEKARGLAIQFCEGPLQSSGRIWVSRLSLEMMCGVLQTDDLAKLFQKALALVELSEGRELWNMAMEFFSGKVSYFDSVLKLLEIRLSGKHGGQAAAAVACSAVDWVLAYDGIQKARQVYNRLLVLPGPSLELFKHCVVLESRRVILGDQEALGCMRRVFDAAVEIYGKQHTELWLEYCVQERKVGSADAASAVYYRATKTLLDPSQFIQDYQLLIA